MPPDRLTFGQLGLQILHKPMCLGETKRSGQKGRVHEAMFLFVFPSVEHLAGVHPSYAPQSSGGGGHGKVEAV